MKKTNLLAAGALLIIMIFSNFLQAENINDIKISGYVISEFYYIQDAADKIYLNYKPKTMRQVYTKERSGYQFRRIYLSFDRTIEQDFAVRLRFEMSNTDFYYSKMSPGVKDAYLKWQYRDNHSAYFGISSSPAFALIEKFWGFRKLEKTASDYFGIRSSRDFGISLKGKLFNSVNYHFFTGNGESNASEETGRIDKLHSLSLSQNIGKHFIYEFYTDYRLSKEGNFDEFTGQIFTGYKSDQFRIGIQYTYQENKLMRSAKKGDIHLISMPVVFRYNKKLNFMTYISKYRVAEEQDYRQTVFVGGFEYKIRNNISIMPNVLYNDYEFENDVKNGKDIIYRITLTYDINKKG